MNTSRYGVSRQKVCQHCSSAKAKCDRIASGCTRCTQRGLACTYHRADRIQKNMDCERQQNGSSAEPHVPSTFNGLLPNAASTPPREGNTQIYTPISESHVSDRSAFGNPPSTIAASSIVRTQGSRALPHSPRGPETFDFAHLNLICPINDNDIRNRWLNTYVPVPGQIAKNYPRNVATFIYRVLKSYAALAVRGRGVPPFIHSAQVATISTLGQPLSACLNLVRVCEQSFSGSESTAATVLQREMNNVYAMHATYDNMGRLAAFQAYLIYCMVYFFQFNLQDDPFLRQAMLNLQELAGSSSRQGLMCIAEQQHARPRWEDWIVAEAKRRALFTMYLFDSVLSTQDGLPTYLGTELKGLPAPAGKSLWQASDRNEWERAYNVHLADWPESSLHIDELWPAPAELDEEDIHERRRRVDQWLENVDEFGMMLSAVTSCTHGG
ncbi:putative Zn(2)-C6 fungal-type domain-containing protein [Seiridium cardinale]